MNKDQATTIACNFLKHIYSEEFSMVASILSAEADKDYDTIIQELEIIKGYIDRLIRRLGRV